VAPVHFGVIYPPQVAMVVSGNGTRTAFAEKGMFRIRTSIFATLAGIIDAADGLTGSHFFY
jgi:pyruvate dehydrogenase E2 component (dihydrolipoamide acetyltransferase)